MNPEPAIDLGPIGAFDDSGVTSSWIVAHEGRIYHYYTGWTLGVTVPFYLAVGLAISEDGGETYRRASPAPILDRSAVDTCLTASPCVLIEDGVWRMWYVSGSAWSVENDRPKHHYRIQYAESRDGLRWTRDGTVCIDHSYPGEHAISRPCVVRDAGMYHMWYAHRGASYRIGHAESRDGIAWVRKDLEVGIDVSPSGWDSEMVAYPWVFSTTATGVTCSTTETTTVGRGRARLPAAGMMPVDGRRAERLLLPALSLAIVFLLLWAEWRIGLNLADEGFLWCGAIRTAQGEVPLRDFQSYEPGRYYWSAAWFALLGDGVLALRISLAAFQAIGLTLGLLVARRLTANPWLLAVVGLAFALWMLPRHKLFEPALAMSTVYVGLRLLERPARSRCFAAGAYAGLVAFVGNNHGLYAETAQAALMAHLWWKGGLTRPGRCLSSWWAGIVVGYAPMLLMWLLVPGYFEQHWSLVTTIVSRGTANLALPVPWPWRAGLSAASPWDGIATSGGSLLFLSYPVFCMIAGLRILAIPRPASAAHSVLQASVAAGVPYMHHAFSRADLSHLAQSIHPMLLGLGALLLTLRLSSRRALAAWAAFLVATAVGVALPSRPLGERLRAPAEFVPFEVAGDRLWLPRSQVEHLRGLAEALDARIAPDDPVWIVPHAPGLYPVLRRPSLLRDLYLIFPASEQDQRRIVRDLGRLGVKWVLTADETQDGRDDLRFRNTHPLVWDHLVKEFDDVRAPGLAPSEQLWRRRPSNAP